MSKDLFMNFWKFMYILYGKEIPDVSRWTDSKIRAYNYAWNNDSPKLNCYKNLVASGLIIDELLARGKYILTDKFIEMLGNE